MDFDFDLFMFGVFFMLSVTRPWCAIPLFFLYCLKKKAKNCFCCFFFFSNLNFWMWFLCLLGDLKSLSGSRMVSMLSAWRQTALILLTPCWSRDRDAARDVIWLINMYALLWLILSKSNQKGHAILTAALRGQTHSSFRKHQQVEKHWKSPPKTQNKRNDKKRPQKLSHTLTHTP